MSLRYLTALRALKTIGGDILTAKAKGEISKRTARTEPKTVIYMGVSIPGTALSYGSIYNNGYPNEVKGLMERIPEIKPLMVEADKITGFKRELNVKGSYAAALYLKLKQRLKEDER